MSTAWASAIARRWTDEMRAAGGFAVLLALALPARAESGTMLTLAEAVELAGRNAPAVHAAAAARSGQEAREREIRGGSLPQITMGAAGYNLGMLGGASGIAGSAGSAGTSGAAGASGAGSVGGLGGLAGLGSASGGLGGQTAPPPGASRFGQFQLTGTQVLYDGGRVRDGLEAARLGQDLADAELQGARRKAQYDAAIAYLNVLKARSLHEVAVEGVEQARNHLGLAQTRVKRGAGAFFEVLQAQSQLSQAQAAATKARGGLDLSGLALETAIGRTVADLEPDPGMLPDLEPDVDLAWSNRPELRQIAIKQDLERSRLAAQQKNALPTVAGLGTYVYQPGSTSYYMLGVTVQSALYNGGQTAARVDQAAAEIEKDNQRLEGQRRSVMLEVRSADVARKEAEARLATLGQGLVTAIEMHRLAQVRYRAGVGTGTEVVDAQAALTQAKGNLVMARFDARIAQVRLAQALGLDLAGLLPTKGKHS